ncbi:MAG: biotin--[acetyl-CoA-carboxylase] ligase [Cyclobacteriaceae bacterium]
MYKIPAKTLFMGKNLVFMPECHSTSTIASELTQMADCVEGTVVITDNQTAGRGQKGSLWQTAPGQNLTFSIVVKPTFLLPKDQFLLSMAISLGILDYLKSEIVSKKLNVKWPNDILVGTKKICGILIENHIQGSSISNSVIGIGLNVNQRGFGDLAATSLRTEIGQDFDLPSAFTKLMSKLESRYLMLKKGNEERLRVEYVDNMYGRDEKLFFWSNKTRFEGVVAGVDEYGCLIVDSGGQKMAFNAKEIRFEF